MAAAIAQLIVAVLCLAPPDGQAPSRRKTERNAATAASQDGVEGMQVTLALPWPPSVNHYYRHVGPRVLISKDGRRYREAVAAVARRAGSPTFAEPVEVSLDLFPPDNRRRDVDNSRKSTLDALTCARVYEDDSLIRKLTVTKNGPQPPRRAGGREDRGVWTEGDARRGRSWSASTLRP